MQTLELTRNDNPRKDRHQGCWVLRAPVTGTKIMVQ